MSDTLLAALPPGPFVQLARLLEGTAPGKPPISLAVGDPSGMVPGFITEALARHADGFGNYPAITGTEEWRRAAADWLNRRFALNGAIDPEKHLLPLSGTREGLFSVLFPLMELTKAGIIARGTALGIDYGLTLSCYDPSPEGLACGACDSCQLRRKGFEEAGVADPTHYRSAA